MSIPVLPAAAQSSDSASRSQELVAQGGSSLKQAGASGEKQSVDSFLQLLQGAARETKGADEPEQGEQAQASASMRLLALLFQLDPAQLANLAGEAAQASGSEGGTAQSGEGGRLLSLLREMSSGGAGQKELFRALTAGNLLSGSEEMAELNQILEQMQGERSGSGNPAERLLALLSQSGGGERSTGQEGKASQELYHILTEAQGSRGSTGLSEQQEEPLGRLVSALREASSQGRLSTEQLDRILQGLESVTSQETSGNHIRGKTGAEAGQLSRLASVLQQAEGSEGPSGRSAVSAQQGNAGNGQPEVNLARLFLESFGRGKLSGQEKGRNSSSAKGSSNFLNQDSSLVRALNLQEGQARSKGPDMSTAQPLTNSEGSNAGVSTKAGEWGSLLSSTLRGSADGGFTGAVSRAGQSSGPSSMMDNQVLQQVVSKLQADLQRGSSQINIRMHPPELGRVQLQLVSEDSNMQVQLQVQNTQVQSILERNMPALRQALEQQDLDFDSIQVSVESGQEDGSREHPGGRGSEFSSSPGWNVFWEDEESGGKEVRGYTENSAGSRGISLRV